MGRGDKRNSLKMRRKQRQRKKKQREKRRRDAGKAARTGKSKK